MPHESHEETTIFFKLHNVGSCEFMILKQILSNKLIEKKACTHSKALSADFCCCYE